MADKVVGWQCENANNCPVREVLLYNPGNDGTAIYIYQIDANLPVDHTFTMQFALVDTADKDEVPLAATGGISVPFKQVSGTPTCPVGDQAADDSNADSYFVDDFEGVYIPGNFDGDYGDFFSDDETGFTVSVRMIVEVTVITAIAVIGALFFGGII
jgi:hypothetical protein